MYKCAACGNVFEEGWSDEEAEAEMRANFGEDTTKEDCVVICDDCYQEHVEDAVALVEFSRAVTIDPTKFLEALAGDNTAARG